MRGKFECTVDYMEKMVTKDDIRALAGLGLLLLLLLPGYLISQGFLDPLDRSAGANFILSVVNTDRVVELARWLIVVSPTVAGDGSKFIEWTPPLIGFSLTILLPKKEQWKLFWLGVFLCCVGYLIYLQLGNYLVDDEFHDSIIEDLQELAYLKDGEKVPLSPNDGASSLVALAVGGRLFFLFVAAGMLGVKVRQKVTGQ